jgi:ATP-dependent RNA helicase DDX3X
MLVKTLLETRQAIPDFLTQYIPEGFADGKGDINLLQFEADEEEGGDAAAGGDGGWGAEGGADAGGWGAPVETPAAPAATGGGWGTEAAAPAAAEPAGW